MTRRYPAYRESGVEWLGAIPEHWEILQSRRLFSERKERARPSDKQLTSSQKLGIVSQEEFIETQGTRVMQVITGADILKHVEPNDFVISMRSFEGGLEHSVISGCISSAYVMLIPSVRIFPGFYKYAFKSTTYIQALQSTTNLVRDGQALRYENFCKVALHVPPLSEQTAIAAFLDRETAKIDALVAEQRRLIELLREKRQAVISHAVTKGLNPNTRMKPSGIDWVGDVPEGWEVKRLRFLSKIETGTSDTQDADEDAEFPFFVRSQTVERIGHFTHDCEAVMTSGDGAGVGKIFHHFKGKFSAHQRVYIFSDFQGVSGKFFFQYLKANFFKVALEGGAKSTVDSLRRPLIANFWMTVPPANEQEEILTFIADIERRYSLLSDEAETAITLLQERRAALISAAVTGKIDVRHLVQKEDEAA